MRNSRAILTFNTGYDSDSLLRLRLDLTFEGAQHTEEVAMGGPSDVVHGASRYAIQVV